METPVICDAIALIMTSLQWIPKFEYDAIAWQAMIWYLNLGI